MRIRYRFGIVAGLAPLLAGCSGSVPDTSDAQLLDLFGNRSTFSSADAPQTIPKRTEECVRLIAGLDKDIYKDMPEVVSGQIKTACRKDFSERLADKARNPTGLKLEHLEIPAFAERVSKVRADAEAKAKDYARAEQERRKAENLRKQQAAVDEAKAKLASVEERLGPRLAAAEQACSDWRAAHEALKQRDRRSPLLNRFASRICNRGFADQARNDLARVEDTVGKMQVKEDNWFTPPMPYFGNADIDKLDEDIAKVGEQVEAMKAA